MLLFSLRTGSPKLREIGAQRRADGAKRWPRGAERRESAAVRKKFRKPVRRLAIISHYYPTRLHGVQITRETVSTNIRRCLYRPLILPDARKIKKLGKSEF